MKTLSFRQWAFSSIFVLAFLSSVSPAADKIGNGGGVWVCQNSQYEIFDIMFMDVFEARREYQLNLLESSQDPLAIVQMKKAWIEKHLPSLQNINKHINYVEKNLTWIDDVINLIPDAAAKISPHPSTCKQGDWTPVQLVNFTDDDRILVRRELFDSAYMSNLEKAAVYLHEGIYSFLRMDFGDTTSVRTRAIVGYLLSDLGDADKVARIQKVLNQASPDPVAPPSSTWICGIKPGSNSALYIFEATSSKAATTGVINACKKGESPVEGGFPGMPFPGGMPGFPGDGFGPGRDCIENNVLCEPVTSSVKNSRCDIEASFSGKIYSGAGRTKLEAQKEAINQCLAAEGEQHRCYSYGSLNCK